MSKTIIQRSLYFTAIAILCVGITGTSNALSLDYAISSVDVSSNSGSGLIIDTTSFPVGTFSLEDGESHTFSAFAIWTPEHTVNSDDQVPNPITATLTFTNPVASSGEVDGITNGYKGGFFGSYQTGYLRWSGPTIITVGDISFSVSLSDVKFNTGIFWGLSCFGGVVTGTVTQLSSTGTPTGSSPIPEPSAAVLFALGAVTVSSLRRRKN